MRHVDYRPPLGLPQYWRDEKTGMLQLAVLAYLGYKAGEGTAPHAGQIDVLRDYLIHYISAPCWVEDPVVLADLHDRAASANNAEDIGDVIERCREIGLDPL